jgi:mono/diheme cytochrome c family protein
MGPSKRMRARVWLSLAALLAMTGWSVNGALARPEGKTDYLKYCASCHGETGKGGGPEAKLQKTPPADLTKLAERNNGILPIAKTYAIIDGRTEVMLHGPRDMPVWGEVFEQALQARMPRDYMPENLQSALVRDRILMILEFISTLQGK